MILGQVQPLTFEVRNADGDLTNAVSVTLTITLPDGTTETPSPTNSETGVYQYDYLPVELGRYVALFTSVTPHGADVKVWDVTGTAHPTVDDVITYLGDVSHSEAEIAAAFEAEQEAQARVCNVTTYGPALREALFRRVQRHLALKAIPLSILGADSDFQPTRIGGTDPEIRRLESGFRKMVVL